MGENSTPYRTEIIRSVSDIDRVSAEWRDFLNTSECAELHHDPDFIIYYSEHINVCDGLRIIMVRDERGLCAVAPFFKQKNALPVKFGVKQLFSVQVTLLSLLGSKIAARKDCDLSDLLNILFEELDCLSKEFDAIYMKDLSLDEPLYAYIEKRAIRASGFVSVISQGKIGIDLGLSLDGTFSDYLTTIKSKDRRELKRELKKLSDATKGQSATMRVERPEQVKCFLGDLDHIFHNCWQGKTFGYKKRDTTTALRFYEHMASKNWLRSYILKYDETPIAYGIGFQYNNKYYYEETAYDLKWAHYNPGKTLIYFLIKDLFEYKQPKIVEFGYGDSAYKQMFANISHRSVYIYVVKKGRLINIILKVQRIFNILYSAIHKTIVSSGIDKHIRKIVKNKKASSS